MKECNIGGGAAISKLSQNGGPLRLLFKTSEEKWNTGRWSPEGVGGEVEKKLLFFSRRFSTHARK